MHKFRVFWRSNGLFISFIFLMFVFRSAVADWNEVPTGSMKPTIVEGDRILVNKMAYDLRIPFSHISIKKFADPERGDIVVFDSAVADKRLVKRVIGLPGDIVEMRDNVLTINGKTLSYENMAGAQHDFIEDLNGIKHVVRTNPLRHFHATFPSVIVPVGQYLMMGDNRDNSADSRVIGFVPRDEIVGRARKVVISLDYDNYYLPRSGRFLHDL